MASDRRGHLLANPRSAITCISNAEKLFDSPRNINHFQADQLKGFLNKNLSLGAPRYPTLGKKTKRVHPT